MAHPWASLGGSCEDVTVLATVLALVENGFVVGTFNFRGAKPSKGTTSWSGEPEAQDFVSFIGFFLHYLKQIQWTFVPTRRASAPSTPGNNSPKKKRSRSSSFGAVGNVKAVLRKANQAIKRSPSPRPYFTPTDLPRTRGPITLILGGYSYGAVILSHLPSIDTIVTQFADPGPLSSEAKIVELSAQYSAHFNARVHASDSEGSYTDLSVSDTTPAPNPAVLTAQPILKSSSIPTPEHSKRQRAKRLPGALVHHKHKSPKRTSSTEGRGRRHSDDDTWVGQMGSPSGPPQHCKPRDELITGYLFVSPVVSSIGKFLHWRKMAEPPFWRHRVLVVTGSKDGLTSVPKVEKWMQQGADKELRVLENGHLWIESGPRRKLETAIGAWAERLDREASQLVKASRQQAVSKIGSQG